ncbi:claspin-like [Argonauta hians]
MSEESPKPSEKYLNINRRRSIKRGFISPFKKSLIKKPRNAENTDSAAESSEPNRFDLPPPIWASSPRDTPSIKSKGRKRLLDISCIQPVPVNFKRTEESHFVPIAAAEQDNANEAEALARKTKRSRSITPTAGFDHGKDTSQKKNKTLSTSGKNRTLSSSGKNRTLSSSGKNRTLSSSGRNRTLSSSGRNRTLSSSGRNMMKLSGSLSRKVKHKNDASSYDSKPHLKDNVLKQSQEDESEDPDQQIESSKTQHQKSLSKILSKKQLSVKSELQKSNKSVSSQKSNKSVSSQKSNKSVSSQKSNKSVTSQKSNKSELQKSNKSVVSQKSNKSVVSQKSSKSVVSQKSKKSVASQKSNKSVVSQKSNKSVVSQKSKKSVVSQKSNKSVASQKSNKSVVSQKSKKSELQKSNKSVVSQKSKKSVASQKSNKSVASQKKNTTLASNKKLNRFQEMSSSDETEVSCESNEAYPGDEIKSKNDKGSPLLSKQSVNKKQASSPEDINKNQEKNSPSKKTKIQSVSCRQPGLSKEGVLSEFNVSRAEQSPLSLHKKRSLTSGDSAARKSNLKPGKFADIVSYLTHQEKQKMSSPAGKTFTAIATEVATEQLQENMETKTDGKLLNINDSDMPSVNNSSDEDDHNNDDYEKQEEVNKCLEYIVFPSACENDKSCDNAKPKPIQLNVLKTRNSAERSVKTLSELDVILDVMDESIGTVLRQVTDVDKKLVISRMKNFVKEKISTDIKRQLQLILLQNTIYEKSLEIKELQSEYFELKVTNNKLKADLHQTGKTTNNPTESFNDICKMFSELKKKL